MHTWKTHLSGVLHRLAETHRDRPLPEIEAILLGALEAELVRFHRADGTRLPRETRLWELLEGGYVVDIRVGGAASTGGDTPAGASRVEPAGTTEETASRFLPGELPPPDGSPEERRDAFVRAFARLEGRHEFMWAGYVVRELLPQFGYPPDETKVVLDRFCAEGVLALTKVPNPRNPTFPATGVRLNHDHPLVQGLLNGGEPDRKGGPTGPGEGGRG